MPVTSENVRRHRSKNRVSLVSFGVDGPSPVGTGGVDDVEGGEEDMRQRCGRYEVWNDRSRHGPPFADRETY